MPWVNEMLFEYVVMLGYKIALDFFKLLQRVKIDKLKGFIER